MSAPTTLNKKQQELVRLHKINPSFNLEAALAEFASKPRGRPSKPKTETSIAPVEDTIESVQREGRIVLEHLENYVPLVRKICGGCGKSFLVNYKSCSFCSDVCRATTLREKYGVIWNPDNTEANRWQYWKVPPSTIKPETLRRLEAFARFILGIEPTEEDLALAEEATKKLNTDMGITNSGADISSSNSRPKDTPRTLFGNAKDNTTRVDGGGCNVSNTAKPRPVSANSGAIQPGVISTDKLTIMSGIKKKFADGEITAHELQVQLAAVLRG